MDLDAVKEIKEVKRARLSEYKNYRPNAEYHEGKGVWSVKCDVALPCATQNELNLDDAKALVANGCIAVAEGANMPTTLEATEYLQKNGILFAPGKAANAGGVATSALEMSQNSERLSWTFEEVDQKLKQIMTDIFAKAAEAGINWEPGWIIMVTTTVKIFIDVFIGVWALVLAWVWCTKFDKSGDRTMHWGDVWARFPRFVLGYIITFAILLIICLQSPELQKTGASVSGTLNAFRVIFFLLTFFTIGMVSNFRKLMEEGIGRLAIVYVVCLFGFIIWLGLFISWLFFHGMTPPLAS